MIIVPPSILIAAVARLLVVAVVGLAWWPAYAFAIPTGLSAGDRRVAAAIWMVGLQSVGALLFLTLHSYALATVALLAVAPWVIRQGRALLRRTQSAYALSPTAEAFAVGLEHLERPWDEWQAVLTRWARNRVPGLRNCLKTITVADGLFWALSLGMAGALGFTLWSYPWIPSGSLNPAYLTTVGRYDALAANHWTVAAVWGQGLYVQLLAWNLLPAVSPLVLAVLVPVGASLLTLFSLLYVVRSTSRSTTVAVITGLVYVGLTSGWARTFLPVSGGVVGAHVQITLSLLWSLWTWYFMRLSFTRRAWVDRLTVGVLVLVATLTGPLSAAAVLAVVASLWIAHLGAPTLGADAGWDLALYVPGTLLLALLFPTLAQLTGQPAVPALALMSGWPRGPAIPVGLGLVSLATTAALVIRLFAVSFIGQAERHAETLAAVLFLAGSSVLSVVTGSAWPLWVVAELIAVSALLSPASVSEPPDRSDRPLHWSMGLLGVGVLAAGFYGLSRTGNLATRPRPLSETLTAYIRIEAAYPRYTWAAVDSGAPLASQGMAATYLPAFWASQAETQHQTFVLQHQTLRLSRIFLFIRYAEHSSHLSLADFQLLGWYRAWRKDGGASRVLYRGRRLTVYEITVAASPNSLP